MTYGCGSDACLTCYPMQYRCEACGTDFETAWDRTLGGKPPVCKHCGYDQIDPDTIDPSVDEVTA